MKRLVLDQTCFSTEKQFEECFFLTVTCFRRRSFANFFKNLATVVYSFESLINFYLLKAMQIFKTLLYVGLGDGGKPTGFNPAAAIR